MYNQSIDVGCKQYSQSDSDVYRIQIVIVNWNTSQLLQKCLDSVYSTCKNVNIDVVVVDNGSTDDSVRNVRKNFPDVILIENRNNVGFAAANNQAMKNNHYKYIILLNSDTILHGNVVYDTVRFLDANYDIGILGCTIKNNDGTPQLSCRRYPTIIMLLMQLCGFDHFIRSRYFTSCYDRAQAAAVAVDVDTISGCAMFVRRSALRNVGLLDEAFFFFGEETDWCRRFRRSGWRVTYANTGEITHLGGASAVKLNYQRDMMLTSAVVRLHQKHGGSFAAGLTWVILFLFAASRLISSSISYVITGDNLYKKRISHFYKIMKKYRFTWPREKTYNPFV